MIRVYRTYSVYSVYSVLCYKDLDRGNVGKMLGFDTIGKY
jgi:hypothetical protein